MPRVVSVSVSMPQMVRIGEMEWLTSIVKTPGTGPIQINAEGPLGNKSAVHPEAVYAIGVEAYDYWAERFGVDRADWEFGRWGENITFEGLFERDLKIGDIVKVGDTLVMQVSAPRNPCVKLSWRLNQPASILKVLVESGVMGFYLRVLTPGPAKAGDDVWVERVYRDNMAILDIPRLFHNPRATPAELHRALAMPALSDYPKMFLRQRLTQVLDAEVASKGRWAGWRKFELTRIDRHGGDIKSFYIKPLDDHELAAYRPGQFLTFRVDSEGGPLIRQWSISDYGVQQREYRISVKREPDGSASKWLHDVAHVGTILSVKTPSGQFALDMGSTKPIVFISAGIGITPALAMLKAHIAREAEHVPPVIWIHVTRNGSTDAFKAEINDILRGRTDITRHVFYTQPSELDVLGMDYDYAGRLSITHIKKIAETIRINLAGRIIDVAGQIAEYYICGPQEMQDELIKSLRSWGVEEFSIHTEVFSPPKLRQANSVDEAEVVFARSGETAIWRKDDGLTLLEFAESLSIPADSSCRMGACHSCMCGLTEGQVDYVADVEDVGTKYALICKAVPASPRVVLEL